MGNRQIHTILYAKDVFPFLIVIRGVIFRDAGLSSHLYLPSTPENGAFGMIEQGSYDTARARNHRQRKE